MASREEMRMIRDARAGQAPAQLALGKRYLYGEGTFARNLATALYWLDRAAQQDTKEAWVLIGTHIPLEVALRAVGPMQLLRWYEQAFDDGVMQAGVVFARLVLQHGDGNVDDRIRRKGRHALEQAASANIPEAQWWLAQQIEAEGMAVSHGSSGIHKDQLSAPQVTSSLQFDWLTRAAENGIGQAQRSLADHAWAASDFTTFLRWSLEKARNIISLRSNHGAKKDPLSQDDAVLLTRCAQALFAHGVYDPAEVERFWIHAAESGDANAQLLLGLWFAKMDTNGDGVTDTRSRANYKQAIHWLTAAAEQGKGEAWYVLAMIHEGMGPIHHALPDSQQCLEKAAEAGHVAAQRELGKKVWLARLDDPSNDIRAVYWLQKAAAQGDSYANFMLGKITSPPAPAPWAQEALSRLGGEVDPLLRSRIELAALFGLTRPEALLVNMHDVDRRHCLLVDIHAQHSRSKRRLILIRTSEQRQLLSRIVQLFKNVECGPKGPEGNYQKRLYRLNAALGASNAKEQIDQGVK